MALAAIWALERLVEPVADAAASFNIAVAARGVGALAAAIAIATAMRQLGSQRTGAQGSPQSDAWTPLRTLGWAAALTIFVAALIGYVAFATFLLNQAIYLSILGSGLFIADIIAQDGTEAVLKPDGPIGARLMAMAGLRRNALAQIAVILQGIARVVVLVVAVAAVLKPWGVQSQDMFGSLRSAYFGFSLGGVTLSLSSMIGAAIVFAVAMFLDPADPELARFAIPAADASGRRRQKLGPDDCRLYRNHRRRAAGGGRKSASMFRNSR